MMQSPLRMLGQSSPLLIARGIVMGALQFLAKRAILAQASESYSAIYADISAIEGFIFIFIFSGLHVISARGAHLHATELEAEKLNSLRGTAETTPPTMQTTFDPRDMGVLYRQSVLFGGLLMIPTALLCIAAPALFSLAGRPKEVIDNSIYYFLIAFFGYISDMLYRSRARIEIGRSKQKPPLIADSVESVLDASITYFLAPKMGVLSAAVAYAIAAAVTAVGMKLYSDRCPELEKYELYRFNWEEFQRAWHTLQSKAPTTNNSDIASQFKKILVGGLYMSATYSIIYLTQIFTTYLCGLSGNGALTALQAAGAYSFMISLPVAGFSDAASVVIGRIMKDNSEEARKLGHFTITTSFLFSAFCGFNLFIFENSFVRLFIENDANHTADFQIVKNFVRIQAIMETANSISNAGADVLSSYFETRFPFRISVVSIFFMNSIASLFAQYIFQTSAFVMYGVQTAGCFVMALSILEYWYHITEPQNAISYRIISSAADAVSHAISSIAAHGKNIVSVGKTCFAHFWKKSDARLRETPRHPDSLETLEHANHYC